MKTLPIIIAATLAAYTPAIAKDAPVDFTRDIAPILKSTCATCHQVGVEAGRMSLVPKYALSFTVNVPSIEAPALMRIAPGKPDQSYLVMKLEGTQVAHDGTGTQMPFGAAPLSPERIKLIRAWIKQGAKP
ncbi:MAG: hypothetical protein KGN34_02960 [Sphingomonadales bacterium]|nr:hypothetical protein [Sphingomonadales bacterium]